MTITFIISDLFLFCGSDGFAFVLQGEGISAVGEAGEGIGYSGISHSVAVEFDTWVNKAYDPNGNHISIKTLGERPNTSDHRASVACNSDISTSLKDCKPHDVRIVIFPVEEKTGPAKNYKICVWMEAKLSKAGNYLSSH